MARAHVKPDHWHKRPQQVTLVEWQSVMLGRALHSTAMSSYELRFNGQVHPDHGKTVIERAHALLGELANLPEAQGVTLAGHVSGEDGTLPIEAGQPHGAMGKPAIEHTGRGETAAPALTPTDAS